MKEHEFLHLSINFRMDIYNFVVNIKCWKHW